MKKLLLFLSLLSLCKIEASVEDVLCLGAGAVLATAYHKYFKQEEIPAGPTPEQRDILMSVKTQLAALREPHRTDTSIEERRPSRTASTPLSRLGLTTTTPPQELIHQTTVQTNDSSSFSSEKIERLKAFTDYKSELERKIAAENFRDKTNYDYLKDGLVVFSVTSLALRAACSLLSKTNPLIALPGIFGALCGVYLIEKNTWPVTTSSPALNERQEEITVQTTKIRTTNTVFTRLAAIGCGFAGGSIFAGGFAALSMLSK